MKGKKVLDHKSSINHTTLSLDFLEQSNFAMKPEQHKHNRQPFYHSNWKCGDFFSVDRGNRKKNNVTIFTVLL